MIVPISFKNNRKETLRGFIHIPKKYDAAVIHLHGFPGSCHGTGKRICIGLAAKGILAMRFDFSGTKTSDGKFEDKLMSQEVKDVKCAIDFLFKNYSFKRFVLSGLSTGAIDASLYAHTDRRIDKLVLLGAESKLNEGVHYDFSDEKVREFWTKGFITYKRPGHWVNGQRLKKAFYDEHFTLDIPKAIRKYRRPLLIIHGGKDEAIPVTKDPVELYKIANKPKKLVIVPGASHTFKKPAHMKRVIAEIVRFIKH